MLSEWSNWISCKCWDCSSACWAHLIPFCPCFRFGRLYIDAMVLEESSMMIVELRAPKKMKRWSTRKKECRFLHAWKVKVEFHYISSLTPYVEIQRAKFHWNLGRIRRGLFFWKKMRLQSEIRARLALNLNYNINVPEHSDSVLRTAAE